MKFSLTLSFREIFVAGLKDVSFEDPSASVLGHLRVRSWDFEESGSFLGLFVGKLEEALTGLDEKHQEVLSKFTQSEVAFRFGLGDEGKWNRRRGLGVERVPFDRGKAGFGLKEVESLLFLGKKGKKKKKKKEEEEDQLDFWLKVEVDSRGSIVGSQIGASEIIQTEWSRREAQVCFVRVLRLRVSRDRFGSSGPVQPSFCPVGPIKPVRHKNQTDFSIGFFWMLFYSDCSFFLISASTGWVLLLCKEVMIDKFLLDGSLLFFALLLCFSVGSCRVCFFPWLDVFVLVRSHGKLIEKGSLFQWLGCSVEGMYRPPTRSICPSLSLVESSSSVAFMLHGLLPKDLKKSHNIVLTRFGWPSWEALLPVIVKVVISNGSCTGLDSLVLWFSFIWAVTFQSVVWDQRTSGDED